MRKRYIVYACVGVVCLAGVVGYMLVSSMRNDSEKNRLNTGVNIDEQSLNNAQPDSNSSGKGPETSKPKVARCTSSALATNVELVEKSTKNVQAELSFTNRSERTCAIGGFPKVSLLGMSGNVVGRSAEESGEGKEELLTLKPLESAASVLFFTRTSSSDGGACKGGATQLSIYPPGATDEVISTTPHDTWCSGFSVTTLTKK